MTAREGRLQLEHAAGIAGSDHVGAKLRNEFGFAVAERSRSVVDEGSKSDSLDPPVNVGDQALLFRGHHGMERARCRRLRFGLRS